MSVELGDEDVRQKCRSRHAAQDWPCRRRDPEQERQGRIPKTDGHARPMITAQHDLDQFVEAQVLTATLRRCCLHQREAQKPRGLILRQEPLVLQLSLLAANL